MRFRQAVQQDNLALQHLLNQNPMSGRISLILARAPDFFSASHFFGKEHVIIVEDNGQPIALCQLTEHEVFLDGKPTLTGYLGGLRIVPSHRGRLSVLKKGFAYLHRHIHPFPAVCYTSIASDNLPARRLLEANLSGLPHYHFVGELATLIFSKDNARQRGVWQPLPGNKLQKFCILHRRLAQKQNFSPVLTEEKLRSIKAEFWIKAGGSEQQSACMALWNQHDFKQVKIQSYAFPINILRPIYNLYAKATKRVRLPQAGQFLDQSFMAFLAVGEACDWVMLISDALSRCQTSVMTLALPANHDQLPNIVSAFSPVIYKTRLYQVIFPGQKNRWLEDALVYPEAAIL